MKTLFIIFCFILTTSVFAQKKKVIIKEIDNYMYKTISNATYETDIDSLKIVLKQYFQQNNFTKTSESDSEMTFYAKVSLICARTRRFTNANIIDDRCYYRTNYRRYYRINNRRYYTTCYQDALVTVSISDENSKKYITILTHIDNPTVSVSMYAGMALGRYKFDELSLRKYLYVAYYGKFVPFPERLANSINDYNAFQDIEQKIIIRSRNYYLYEQQ